MATRFLIGVLIGGIGYFSFKRYNEHKRKGKSHSEAVSKTVDQLASDVKDVKDTSEKIAKDIKKSGEDTAKKVKKEVKTLVDKIEKK